VAVQAEAAQRCQARLRRFGRPLQSRRMPAHSPRIPCLAFVAPSGTGKTTLLSEVVRALVGRGLRLCVLKSTHHDVQLDTPGKDTFRFAQAGASVVGLMGPGVATFFLAPGGQPPERAGKLSAMDMAGWLSSCPHFPLDLVLCEGFNAEPDLPKLLVVRGKAKPSDRAPPGQDLVAVASADLRAGLPASVPLLALDGAAVASWVVDEFLPRYG
ncbi:MAG: molybdopterin-guanine dinucleotide biosynthesis protein B, partial [Planctomycetota bacterium]